MLKQSMISGHYAYVESSNRQRGDKAVLYSPLMTEGVSELQCLRFWYHMYGKNTGTLQVGPVAPPDIIQ
ncbi:hypothetical protein EB796_004169 [Bugula neritina]|uniref:MAM domain-containing protein n=1 Tax=Bugula neritina TaxID=10212 RepID=A0A7J7KFT3_BUGNE|nr:hypothetical protein EB796_004169 [Bugula neritina]